MIMRFFLTKFLLGLSSVSLYAQIGQPQAFQFLNLSPSARITALGGMQVVAAAEDTSAMSAPGGWWLNPALSYQEMDRHLSLSYQPYYADVDYVNLNYTHKMGEKGSWGLGVQYLNYGEIDSYDLTGQPMGTFHSQEYAVVFNRSHQQGPFRMGLNTRLVVSELAGFGASALLFDLGGVFVHPSQDFTAGLTISNVGLMLNDYTSMNRSRLPSDLRLGLAYKPRYMPFRFYMSGYFLLSHGDAYFSAHNNEMPGYVNRILRHTSLGGELLLSRHFHVLFGYNHLKGSTLQLEQLTGGAGISFGFSLRLRFLQLDFSRAFYHVAGGVSHFTLTTDLERLYFLRK
ncbi:MAG: type IX secretion system protein PorQ [Cyclobacteriaceae bacterium]